jgi:hypothetical protein
MKRIKIILILLLTIFSVNCTQDNSESDTQYNIKNSDCSDIKGTEYSICLEYVNDSRCPSNGVCVWEGNASANFVLNSITENQSFTLNTQKNFQRDTIINGLKIELISVSPYPLLNSTTNQNEYSIEINISNE